MSDNADYFASIDTAIHTAFLPALLGGTTPTTIPPDLRTLLSLPVKVVSVGMPNPNESANNNHTTSSVCTSVLTDSLLDGISLVIGDHQVAIQEGRTVAQSSRRANSATTLASLLVPMDALDSQRTTRNTETGAWISVQPTLVNGLSLLKDKWRDRMRQRYGLGLVDLPRCCDGYGTKFTTKHTVACKKGGLVVSRHNEIKAETGGIAIQALGSNRVRDEPKVITCRDTPNAQMPVSAQAHPPSRAGPDPSISPKPSATTTPSLDHGRFFDRGNFPIAGLCEKQTSCVVDMRVINTYQLSYRSSTPAQALPSQEKVKKKKYGELCSE